MNTLRLADWLTDTGHPGAPVHAYQAIGPIPFRGACGNGHWTVKAALATTGPLCPACREIIADAAFRALEEITALEQADIVPVVIGEAG